MSDRESCENSLTSSLGSGADWTDRRASDTMSNENICVALALKGWVSSTSQSLPRRVCRHRPILLPSPLTERSRWTEGARTSYERLVIEDGNVATKALYAQFIENREQLLASMPNYGAVLGVLRKPNITKKGKEKEVSTDEVEPHLISCNSENGIFHFDM